MLVPIISTYLSSDNVVICITRGDSYKFPYRLKTDKAESLMNAIIIAGRIETDRWIKL